MTRFDTNRQSCRLAFQRRSREAIGPEDLQSEPPLAVAKSNAKRGQIHQFGRFAVPTALAIEPIA